MLQAKNLEVRQRVDMVNTVIRYTNVTVDTLLHGNINLTTDVNQEIFKAVHKYVRLKFQKTNVSCDIGISKCSSKY